MTARVRVNGIDVAYELSGPVEAPVVALSHSLAACYDMWEPQMTALRARYRVLRFDTRGHGCSDAPPGPYSTAMIAEDARQLFAALGIRRLHFVGLSMGGVLGQVLAAADPGLIQSLAICCSLAKVPAAAVAGWEERIQTATSQGMEPLVEGTIGRWFTPPFIQARADVVDRVRAMIRATPPAGYVGCGGFIRSLDITGGFARITAPTLVICGADDPSTPPALSQAIHAGIKGSTLIELKSAAHFANMEQPEAFNQALLAHLARHG
jgi:3-oxoadipate enol-lactonase